MTYSIAFLSKDTNEKQITALLECLMSMGFTLVGKCRIEVNGSFYTLRSTMFDGCKEITCYGDEDDRGIIYICEDNQNT